MAYYIKPLDRIHQTVENEVWDFIVKFWGLGYLVTQTMNSFFSLKDTASVDSFIVRSHPEISTYQFVAFKRGREITWPITLSHLIEYTKLLKMRAETSLLNSEVWATWSHRLWTAFSPWKTQHQLTHL